jgi:hypothetical protein
MMPTQHKTLLERAEDLDVAAKIAHENQDHVFAQQLAQHAHHLRMEHQQESKNGQLKKD